ncbi:MAG: hypothetical protein H0X62_00630 [Bacteroidetes bacterium]|nr:hypothetical protein [Bacteroidota bacterium]
MIILRAVVFLFLTLSYSQIYAGCCIADDKTLTELLFNQNQGTVYSCRIISSEIDKDGRMFSYAKILKVYFGEVDSSFIRLNTGGLHSSTGGRKLEPDKEYLIYFGRSGKLYSCCSICDRRSKEISDEGVSAWEIDLVSTFSDIINNKRTGSYTFKDFKGNVIAKGSYIKGKVSGIWRHYVENEKLKTAFDFKTNIISVYYINGYIKIKEQKAGNVRIYEIFSDKEEGLLTLKTIDSLKADDYKIHTYYEYYSNGQLSKTYGQFTINGEGGGFTNSYKEFYVNGNFKVKGQYLKNKKIGLWVWYDEYGTLEEEIDYFGM